MTHTPVARRRASSGFTLIEMIVVTLLLSVAMLGLLAVFDASARINKSETDVADAQGSVRYGIYQMTRAIRMAGAGGLYVTQAVLNHADTGLPGVAPSGVSYDNVAGVTVVDTGGTTYTVRPGTDMIEVRGVIFSPLLGFIASPAMGCNGCTGVQPLDALPIVGDPVIGQHVNDDPTQRPQFAAIDAYTATAATQPMLVIVQDGNTDLHAGCSDPTPGGVERYPQSVYNVGVLSQPTTLVSSNTFGDVDFGGTIGPRFNGEMPSGVLRRPPLRSSSCGAPAFSTTSSSSSRRTRRPIRPVSTRSWPRESVAGMPSRSPFSPTTSRTCRSPTGSTGSSGEPARTTP